MDIKRTGTFRVPHSQSPELLGLRSKASKVVLEGLAQPGAILDRHGIIECVNEAFVEMLGVPSSQLRNEPILLWILRPAEREAFGRDFLAFRDRIAGQAFARDLDFSIQTHAGVSQSRRNVRVCKLADDRVLLTCDPARMIDPEAELGRAVNQALNRYDQGMFLLSDQGVVLHANVAAHQLLGERVVGRGFLEFVPPREVVEVGHRLEQCRSASWRGEIEMLRDDGEPLPVELFIAGSSGIGTPLVVFCRDLRALRQQRFDENLVAQMDRALVSSAEPREALTAACQTLVRELSADQGLLITHFSGSWKRWEVRPERAPRFFTLPSKVRPPAGWARERKVIVQSPRELRPEALVGRFEGDASLCRLALRAAGGVVGYLILAREGRYPWSEHECGLIAQLGSQLALGLSNGLLTLETRALVAYQARVLDQTAVLLNSVDAQGRIVTWNRASEQLAGVSSENAKGRFFGIDVASAADPESWRELWRSLKQEGMVTRELMVLDQHEEPVPIHLEGRLLRDGAEVLGAVFVGLDLRLRRALETQVLQSQKMAAVGLLAAGIAHEINNPLTGVVGYSRLLMEQRSLDPEVRRKVKHIADSGERCRKIVESVLLFSRQGDSQASRTRLDLGSLIDRVVSLGEYQWKMHNVRILRELAPDISVMADADQIEQVLLNLLSNAVDAMEGGGNIEIALRPGEAGGAEITVRDEGCGIPPEARDHIFDPFFSTKDIGKGTGLGLSISYGIVQEHGGDITLSSQIGVGTTFTVVLPANGEAQRQLASSPGQNPAPTTRQR